MIEITTQEQWETLLNTPTPFFIFKHSTTCPISAHARNRVEVYLANRTTQTPPINLVKVIESRPLSNAIAKHLNLTHQSPQLILINNNQAQWDDSHHWITEESITEAVQAHT